MCNSVSKAIIVAGVIMLINMKSWAIYMFFAVSLSYINVIHEDCLIMELVLLVVAIPLLDFVVAVAFLVRDPHL